MSTINQQPLADPLSLADLIAVWSSGNSDTRRASLTSLLALIQTNIVFPSLNPGGQVTFLPFVGGTNSIVASTAADVTLPAAPVFGQTVEWIATGTNTGPATIQVSSLGGAQPVKAIQYRGDALVGGEIDAAGSCLAIYDGAAYQLVASARAPSTAPQGGNALIGGYLDWTVAGNALTLAVKADSGNDPSPSEPVYYSVRDVLPSTGKTTMRPLTAALNLVVPNGALLGTVSAIAFRLWGAIYNDAGVDRLAVINCLSTIANAGSGRNVTAIYPLSGFGIGTTIAVSAAAANAQTFYTNNGIASKPFTTIGYATWETGVVTAGQWSVAPTTKQLFGPGVPLPGQIIQVVETQPGAVIAGVTAIPLDNTIPQNTEGTQAYSLAITTKSAANVLQCDSAVYATQNTGGGQHILGAIFVDAVANAVAAASAYTSTDGTAVDIPVSVPLLASAIATVKLRFGNASGATTYFNGISGGGGIFGGVASGLLKLTEIMA